MGQNKRLMAPDSVATLTSLEASTSEFKYVVKYRRILDLGFQIPAIILGYETLVSRKQQCHFLHAVWRVIAAGKSEFLSPKPSIICLD